MHTVTSFDKQNVTRLKIEIIIPLHIIQIRSITWHIATTTPIFCFTAFTQLVKCMTLLWFCFSAQDGAGGVLTNQVHASDPRNPTGILSREGTPHQMYLITASQCD